MFQEDTYQEKRRHPRIAVNAFIRFCEKLPGFSERWYLPGIMKNYSQSGMCISTNYRFPKGCVITIEVPISSNFTIVEIRGIVRWEQQVFNRWGMGIEYFELAREDREHLTSCMAKLLH